MRRSAVGAVVLVLAVLGSAMQAVADPLPHGDDPRVVNVRPLPGEVVPAGAVPVGGLVVSDVSREGSSVEVAVDGAVLPSAAGSGSHVEVGATADLAPGSHVATISVDGMLRRAWRFDTSGLRVERLAAGGRFTTAVRISQDLVGEGERADAAVLARGDEFADALAGAPLATAVGGPLLLTGGQALDIDAAAELQRVLPAGASVYLLGGVAALGEQVARDVEGLGFEVERLAGADRFATATEVADLLVETAAAGGGAPETATAGAGTAETATAGTVVLASGGEFADALSMSSPAATRGWPILLTGRDGLARATRDFLTDVAVDTVVVVGGEAAVSAAVATEVDGLAGTVDRVAGNDRFATARTVAGRFFGAPAVVAVADGGDFPDALAGGPHAAALGAPLLLTGTDDLPEPQRAQVAAGQPERAVIYGGVAAIADSVAGDLRRAHADGAVGSDPAAAGPALRTLRPAPGSEVVALDEVVVGLDREVSLADSTVAVTIGGNEVAGTLGTGDFADTLVLEVDELPSTLAPGQRYDARVVVAARAPGGALHLDEAFAYVEPIQTLTRGDRGPAVTELQQRLTDAGYWLGGVDGAYGMLTSQAVMALQKVHGLTRDGVYGPATRAVLESAPARPQPQSTQGLVIEIDKARQVLMMVRDGRVEWVFNTSTGTEQPYIYEGQEYLADTPVGRFRVTREVDGVREGPLGRLYRPKYFHPDGIAFHGSASIPAFPASHGCARVTNAAMDYLFPRVPIGAGVWVY